MALVYDSDSKYQFTEVVIIFQREYAIEEGRTQTKDVEKVLNGFIAT